jgi:ACS family tartrate transporter-like MFS transporter
MSCAAAALALGFAAGDSVTLAVVAFSIVAAGALAYLPSFWAMPTAFLTESAAAASIGLINSFGNLGGFVGPYLVGYIRTATGSFTVGMLCLAASLLGGAVMVLFIRPAEHETA